MIKKAFFVKILISTLFVGVLFLVTTRIVSAQSVYDLEITCDPDPATECEVSPSNTAPVFTGAEFPEGDLKPGDALTRQIYVENNRTENCYFTIDSFSVTEDTETSTGVNFSEELFTAFSTDTDSTGEVRFADLFASTPLYLGVIPSEGSEVFDWEVRFAESAGNEFQNAVLNFNFVWTFQCAEEPPDPVLYIEKTNSELGVLQSPGDSVVYTITVTAPDYPVFNVVVIDLPPGGFYYRDGSWTATSDLRGDLAALGVTLQPDYESPGTWQLGDMAANETVTLTYVADISEDTEPGEYPDIAWAVGDAEDDPESADVLANEDTGYFVGTDVEVGAEDVSPDADVEVEEEEVEEEVLGAATGLPATGADSIWVKIVLGVFGLGVLFVLFGTFLPVTLERSGPSGGSGVKESPGKKGDSIVPTDRNSRMTKGKGKILSILIFTLLTLAVPQQAFAANVIVRLQEPESHINTSSFKLNFVALDIKDRPITVKCYKKEPGEAVFAKFGPDHNLAAGGDSGYCDVGSNILDTEGTYEFYVEGVPNGVLADKDTSSTVVVKYDKDAPEAPEYIKKDSSGCEDEIEIEVGDNGETDIIRVYRSKDKDFEANSGTEIKEIDVDPGEEVDFETTRPDCNETYYYAVIAFDAAGNRSDVTAEKLEGETVTVTVSEEVAAEAAGAEVIAEGEAQVGAPGEEEEAEAGEEEAVEEEGEVAGEEEDQGEVAGAEVEEGTEEAEQVGVQSAVSNFLSRGGWILLAVIALGLTYLGKRVLKR